MDATERSAGLYVCGPGEGMDAKLLNGMRGGVATADKDTADWSGRVGEPRKEFAKEIAEGDAEEISVGRQIGCAKRGVEDRVPSQRRAIARRLREWWLWAGPPGSSRAAGIERRPW